MQRIVLAAVVLAAATPALANDQLARSLGVEPGRYTTAELVILKNASTHTSNEGRVHLGHSSVFSSQGVHNPVAIQQFRRAHRQSNEGGLAD